MVTIRHDGQNMSVLFRQAWVGRLCETGFEDVEQTTCMIVGNDGKALAVGLAHRAPNDETDLDLAMELSYSRAVKTLTTDKTLRIKFWQAYWTAQAAEKRTEQQQIAEAQQQLEDAMQVFTESFLLPVRPNIIDVTPPSVQDSPYVQFSGTTLPWPEQRDEMKLLPKLPSPGVWPSGRDFDVPVKQPIQLPASFLTDEDQELLDSLTAQESGFCKGKCSVCDVDRKTLATLREKVS